MQEIRRGDPRDFIQISSFPYLRSTVDDNRCVIKCTLHVEFEGSFRPLGLSRTPAGEQGEQGDPLVGFLDDPADSQRVVESLLLPEVSGPIEVFVHRDRFLDALGSSPWLLGKVTLQLDLEYDVTYKKPQPPRRLQAPARVLLAAYPEAELAPLLFCGCYEFDPKPLRDILREDDESIGPSELVEIQPDLPDPALPRVVILHQEANCRFSREALFAFGIVPVETVPGAITPDVVRATVSITFPKGFDDSLRATPLFEICQAAEEKHEVDEDEEEKHEEEKYDVRKKQSTFWDLTPIVAREPLRPEPDGRATMEYLLAVQTNYVLCLRLHEINFYIERLFLAHGSAITVELLLHPYRSATAPAVHRVEIRLARSRRKLGLIAAERGHKAVVFDAGSGIEGKPVDIRIIDSSANEAGPRVVAVQIVNLSGTTVDWKIDIPHFDEPFGPYEGYGIDVRVDPLSTKLSVITDQGEAAVRLKPLSRLRTEIIALDIGTMATAIAYGRRGEQNIKAVRIGDALEGAPGISRRESQYGTMLPSICGVSIVEASEQMLPIQAEFDDRLLKRFKKSELRAAGVRRRLQTTHAPVEIHLPLCDRLHEKRDAAAVLARGFVAIASAKTQVCAFSHLRRGAESPDFPIWWQDGTDMPVRIVLSDLRSEELLAAVLDALLAVYFPKTAGWRPVTGIDHDFVLTYPASIGDQARDRYQKAFKSVVAGMQQLVKGVFDPEIRGRHRLRMVPESLAACFALADSQWLWANKSSKAFARRLVLFDIGAGTVDVSAIEFLRRPSDQAVYQTQVICQTVSFSLPLGGDVLDHALVRDFQALMAREGKALSPAEDSEDLRSRIEWGKRLTIEGRYLPVVLTPGVADIEPSHGDTFFGWKPQPAALKIRGSDETYQWMFIDLDNLAADRCLQDYLLAIERLVVVPTMRAAGPPDAGYADVEVVMSGRASLFVPLERAVARGIKRLGEWRDRDLQPVLASKVLDDTPDGQGAETMKGLVARGAARWSQGDPALGKARRAPLASNVLAHFALVTATWNPERRQFEKIGSISDIPLCTTNLSVPPDQSLFVVVRPPLLRLEDIPGSFQDGHGLELLNRCIRPIVLKQAPGIKGGFSPLAFGDRCKLDEIELAPPGSQVEFMGACEEGRLSLMAKVGGKSRQGWNFSGTFTFQFEL
jgi:hypothetical protein